MQIYEDTRQLPCLRATVFLCPWILVRYIWTYFWTSSALSLRKWDSVIRYSVVYIHYTDLNGPPVMALISRAQTKKHEPKIAADERAVNREPEKTAESRRETHGNGRTQATPKNIISSRRPLNMLHKKAGEKNGGGAARSASAIRRF